VIASSARTIASINASRLLASTRCAGCPLLALLASCMGQVRRVGWPDKVLAERIARLEQDADALVEHYTGMVPESLEGLTSRQRHDVYRMMRLKVLIPTDGEALGGADLLLARRQRGPLKVCREA
jgi:hypothetical protein